MFNLFDDEKTGFVSVKNLRKITKELGEQIDEHELQEMIDKADLDNDGLVSEEEFYQIMTKRSWYDCSIILIIIWKFMDKKGEDPSTKELNAFVQNMLKQMQDRFEEMSGNIVGRVDEMGKKSFFTQGNELMILKNLSTKLWMNSGIRMIRKILNDLSWSLSFSAFSTKLFCIDSDRGICKFFLFTSFLVLVFLYLRFWFEGLDTYVGGKV